MPLTASSTALAVRFGLIGLLVARAHARRQLTPAGLLAALVTGIVHAIHPWSIFFALLVVFFIAGNVVTKVNHAKKATLTSSAAGTVLAAPHPRSAIQVICNSLPATLAIAAHWVYLDYKMHAAPGFLVQREATVCLPHPRATESFLPPGILNALPYAVFAHYAAAAADTFASELGILSRREPVLVTAPWRRVPRGTNGGVSLAGLLASALGAAIIGLSVAVAAPFCRPGRASTSLVELRTAYMHGYTAESAKDGQRQWLASETLVLTAWLVVAGVAGGLLDSLLGALLQASVLDTKSGRIVEGSGGARVRLRPVATLEKEDTNKSGGRRVVVGRDVLSNNGVNLLMALLTSATAWAAAAGVMGVTLASAAQDSMALGWVVRQQYGSADA